MQLDLGLLGSTLLEPMCHGFGMVAGLAVGRALPRRFGGPPQEHAGASPQVSGASASGGATV